MEIRQIIPADRWRAVMADSDEPNGVWADPLVCWALVDGWNVGENNHVMGMAASSLGITPIEESSNFLCYVAPGDSIDPAINRFVASQLKDYQHDLANRRTQ